MNIDYDNHQRFMSDNPEEQKILDMLYSKDADMIRLGAICVLQKGGMCREFNGYINHYYATYRIFEENEYYNNGEWEVELNRRYFIISRNDGKTDKKNVTYV